LVCDDLPRLLAVGHSLWSQAIPSFLHSLSHRVVPPFSLDSQTRKARRIEHLKLSPASSPQTASQHLNLFSSTIFPIAGFISDGNSDKLLRTPSSSFSPFSPSEALAFHVTYHSSPGIVLNHRIFLPLYLFGLFTMSAVSPTSLGIVTPSCWRLTGALWGELLVCCLRWSC
jgi:hypothetical protein